MRRSISNDLGFSYFQDSTVNLNKVNGRSNVRSAVRMSCERLEKIEQLLDSNIQTIVSSGVCNTCVGELFRKSERRCAEVILTARAYRDLLRAKQNPPTAPSVISLPKVTLNQNKSLKEIDTLKKDILSLKNEENFLLKQLSEKQKICGSQASRLEKAKNESISLDFTSKGLEEDLNKLLNSIDSVTREINGSRKYEDKNLELSSSSRDQVNHINHTRINYLLPLFDDIQFMENGITCINKKRLFFHDVPTVNLNWTEINGAWCNLAIMIQCLRNNEKLADEVDLFKLNQIFVRPYSSPSGKTQGSLIIRIRPLVVRALLLVRIENRGDSNNQPSPVKPTKKEEIWYIEGGVNKQSTSPNKISKIKAKDKFDLHYQRSIVLFAATICATLLEINFNRRVKSISSGGQSVSGVTKEDERDAAAGAKIDVLSISKGLMCVVVDLVASGNSHALYYDDPAAVFNRSSMPQNQSLAFAREPVSVKKESNLIMRELVYDLVSTLSNVFQRSL